MTFHDTARIGHACPNRDSGRRSNWLTHVLTAAFAIAGSVFGLHGTLQAADPVSVTPGPRISGLKGWVTAIAWSPNGQQLAVGTKGEVALRDAATGDIIRSLPIGKGQVRAVTYLPGGEALLIGGYQAVLQMDVASGEVVRKWTGPRGAVTAIAISPSGSEFAVASDDETVQIFSFEKDEAIQKKAFPDEPANAVAWSPDGARLAIGLGDETRPTRPGRLVVLDAQSGDVVLEKSDARQSVTGVAFAGNGNRVLAGSLDERVYVYDLATGEAHGFFGGHSRPVNALGTLPGGAVAVSASGGKFKDGQNTKLWQIEDGAELAVLEGHDARISALALTADGLRLATGSYDGTVAIWSIAMSAAPAEAVAATEAIEAAKPEESVKQIRIGIIGLDTSHATAFAKLLNDPKAEADVANCKVVAAYPKGSPDIESSVTRVPGYTEQLKELGVEIVDSIPALVEKVDCVLLETNDGRPHLEQVLPVLKAGKPCFIDKPIAGSLADAIAILSLAKHYKVPVFSSSSLRYVPSALDARAGKLGKVLGCDAYSPASLEKTHPDLFWYGIHGVELLFTTMGPGCQSVTRVHTPGMDQVTGTWADGRIGTFRGIREGKSGYGGTVYTDQGISQLGSYPGYRPLVVEFVKMFRTGEVPIDPKETLEIYAFMEAADESKRMNGAPVSLEFVMERARQEAEEKIAAGKK
ncbi:MAG: PQQ-binding-like beta-propeller repeat protein [Planctomycetaceae bacterium]|nr:PQQ-binding-like beta-propeller repeat protein [Planctomycetaceae bacterium]